jgi:glycosyltransferase involved in cell wall biosynthesis
MVDRRGRIGLVPARFGDDILGGAEIVLREMATGLQARGWDVEILTTCARDHHTWENVYPAGVTQQGGLSVRRFEAVWDTRGPERSELEAAVMAGSPLPVEQQQRWMNLGMRVPSLYHYLLEHAQEYRGLIFAPYPFWPSFACSQVAPEKSVLWTCLHDEPYAYLELFRPVFEGVAGLWFQSDPEHDLAHRIHPRLAPHRTVGCGVDVPESYDVEGFRAAYGIEGRFVLYAGRREGAKGWDELLNGFAAAVRSRDLPLQLVTMGGGPVEPPEDIADRVVDVGFLPDHWRDAAFAAADAYVQPSRYEAFSRTIMEAWLAGTPVIGNAGSAVVKDHIEKSGAGLVYDDDYELEECLAFVADEPAAAAALAAPGRDYVLRQYRWPAVLDRLEDCLEDWLPPVKDATPALAGEALL